MKSILISIVLFVSFGIGHAQKNYQPRFWVDGIADDIKVVPTIASIVERAKSVSS